MHELVAIAAVPEHVHRRAVSDELEEDRHDPEPAVTEDRAGSDDRDVQARGDRLVAQHLGPQLRAPVGLERTARRALGDGVVLGDPEDRARRRVHDLRDARVTRRDEQVRGTDDVHGVEQFPILRQRHLRDVVQHDVDPLTRSAQRVAIADVTPHVLDRRSVGGRRVHVEHPDGITRGDRALREHGAEVPAPARDEHRTSHQSAAPRSRHHRMLARIPSSKPTAGS